MTYALWAAIAVEGAAIVGLVWWVVTADRDQGAAIRLALQKIGSHMHLHQVAEESGTTIMALTAPAKDEEPGR